MFNLCKIKKHIKIYVLKNNLPYHGKKKQRAEWKQAAQEFVKQRFNLKLNNDTAEAICIAFYYIEREVG